MATLVLAATATPASIVSCGQDCGRQSGGWVVHPYKARGYILIETAITVALLVTPIDESLQLSTLLDQP